MRRERRAMANQPWSRKNMQPPLARVPSCSRHQVYQAQIHQRAMETTFPLRGRCEVGFAAIIQQARTRGEYGIEREAGPLQSHRSKKRDIEVGASPGAEMGDIQRLYRIKGAERTPPILRTLQLPIDPPRQDGLVVAIVKHQNGAARKIACELCLELPPGRGGL